MVDKLKESTGFMAFSEKGYPAHFIGVHGFARWVRDAYQERFGSSLAKAGYRVHRVRIVPLQSKAKKP